MKKVSTTQTDNFLTPPPVFSLPLNGMEKLDSSPFKEEIRWGMGLWVAAETKRLEAAGGQEGDGIRDEI